MSFIKTKEEPKLNLTEEELLLAELNSSLNPDMMDEHIYNKLKAEKKQ